MASHRWYWPSEDPRFVGKWDIGRGTIILRANGVLEQYYDTGELSSKRRWKVIGDTYYDGSPTADPAKMPKWRAIDSWLYKNWNVTLMPRVDGYAFEFRTPGELVLTHDYK
jgi:hypothetical protein